MDDCPALYGDDEVIRVLLSRRTAGDRPGSRRDEHKVALVVGGGGMRGAYTAGMLRGLEHAGLRAAFDEVYGASSGAFGGAAFLAGQSDEGAACYPEDLASRGFINLARLGTARPVLSLDYLLGDVLERRKPLRWESLVTGAVPLRVVATDAVDLSPHILSPRSAPQWSLAIRASASIPLLAGPPTLFDGHRWIDGSVSEPLAVTRAVRAGATHVLALLCRGRGDMHSRPDAALSAWSKMLDRVVPGLGTLTQGSRRYHADLRLITTGAGATAGTAATRLAAIAPWRSSGVTGLCTDPYAVNDAVNIGEASAASVLDHFARR